MTGTLILWPAVQMWRNTGQIGPALTLIRGMQVGELWTFREHPKTVGEPVHRVQVVRLSGPRQQGDVHIRFLDGEEAGLQEWVSRTQLIVPWQDAPKFLLDDENWQKLMEQAPETRGKVELDAARLVIEVAQLKRSIKLRQGGICEIADRENIAKAAGLDVDVLLGDPLSFVDRLGNVIAPWPTTLLLVQGFARRFSDEIFEATQRRYATLKDRYGLSWRHNDNELVRADHLIRLVREWGGEDANERHDELQALRAEVERLGALVERAVTELRRRKAHSIAATIERDLGVLGATGGSPPR